MSTNTPLITVVIPAYNCQTTIRNTLRSVFEQTYSTLEIIVVDDGSTDDTLDILKTLDDDRLTVLTQPNAGVSASRNRGLRHASGEFVALLDSDDLWLPDKLADQLEALQSESQAAVAYSWTDYIDQTGEFVRKGYYCNFQGKVHQQLLLGSFLESGSNPLIRHSALEAVGGFDESLRTCEDWDLWIRLSLHYPFVVVPKVHVKYRIATHSKSFLLDRHEAGGLAVIDKAFSQTLDSSQLTRSRALSNFYKYLLFKLLDAPKTPQLQESYKSQRALRYLGLSIYYHPQLLRQIKVVLSAFVRILAMPLQSSR
ncbi:glycosyltransferase [Leptolyngbya cf. ectocarpi LEGE 11479]|uniref:Glycosyltransferase n=1 Tax=Leptolyngbya cf. ectocarpi LEGE 11479 TaxID=1828722 RepID=A0A928ZWV5_LEPEC|nr:glycosyltransferase [Leptolyngbya ectocarpi]MBE9068951.1 glycosyltransferase [Leptolyngbya cf. ectocarpi LEGE 11479]